MESFQNPRPWLDWGCDKTVLYFSSFLCAINFSFFFLEGLILKKYTAPQTPSQFLCPENPNCGTSQPHWIFDIVKARFQSTNQINSRAFHSYLSWHIQIKHVSISIYYLTQLNIFGFLCLTSLDLFPNIA